MEFHPSQIPIAKTYDVKDEKEAEKVAQEMVKLGFLSHGEKVRHYWI